MQLYAANCTPQEFELNYRVPESDRSLKTRLPSGMNQRVGDGSYNAFQVQGIIDQGKSYGMYDVKDMERIPDGMLITVLFSRDEPVKPEIIRDVMSRNRRDLTVVGAERRKELAVAAAHVMNQNDPARADRASVAIQEDQPGTMSSDAGTKLEEGYAGPESRVAKEAGMAPVGGSKRNRRR